MGSFWEQMILGNIIGVLALLKKNPARAARYTSIIQHIVVDACEILGVQPPALS